MAKIAVIPGDGIGPEVTTAAMSVVESVAGSRGVPCSLEWLDYGAERWLAEGVGLPDGALTRLAEDFDAIFLGALGDPRIPDMAHGKEILLGLRFGLDLYVNHRPVRLLDARHGPLKARTPDDVDFVVFRENTEGAYVGIGGTFKPGTSDEVATQEIINTRKGVERIIRHAFAWADAHGSDRVCMSDKSNVFTHGHGLWRRVFEEVSAEHPHIEPRHLYVDVLAMEMVRDPSQFDVIVTCNMFGDIVSDLGAQLQGGLGLAPSANVNPDTGTALFEPVHGSAPDIAGTRRANPLAAILSAQLMFEHLGLPECAADIESSVRAAITEDVVTPDMGGDATTTEVAQFVCRHATDREE